MTCLALHSRADRGSDVNRCMGGWVIVLWEWRFGGTAPLGCHGSRRIVPRGDGRAFLGRREHRNGGVHTSRSWDLAKYSKAKALKCMRVVPTRGWCRSCALRLTLPWGQWKSQRSLSVRLCIRRCLHLWSKCAIYGSALLSMLRRQSTLSRRSRLPDGLFRRHWQGLSPAFLGSTEVDRGTSCHGVMHHLPLLNHHLDQRVKPLAGCVRGSDMAVQRPPIRALPVSPCLHEDRRGRPCPVTGSGHQDPQLDDWLILAQSWEQLCDHRDLVLRHLSQLGLQVYLEKSKLSPVQRISFLGVELDSVSMTARLTDEHCPISAELPEFLQRQDCGSAETVQRLLGHMASTAGVMPLGLLHMRPLHHWLHSRVHFRWTSHRKSCRSCGMDRPCFSTGQDALRTIVLVCCWHNICLQHGLGRYMQWAGSLGALDGASTDLAHQLLRADGRASTLATLRKYAFPPVSLLAQTLCKVREDEKQVLLVAPYWPTRTWCSFNKAKPMHWSGACSWTGVLLAEKSPAGEERE